MSRVKTLQRRLQRVEKNLEAQAERESWRATPERRREISMALQLGLLRMAFCGWGFEGFGRRWSQQMRKIAEGTELEQKLDALPTQIGLWASRFKATGEQRDAAIEAARRGLANPFSDEEWSAYCRGGARDRPTYFDSWLETSPPRWEIACAVAFSRINPNSRHYSMRNVANPLRQDIETVDKHFGGPRTRRKEPRLEELRIRFEPASPKSSTPHPKNTTVMGETTPADRLRRRIERGSLRQT